jgi:formate hydrogenlyase subunit 3/multisubunit Na+/H+ antiporter MnhD subunit
MARLVSYLRSLAPMTRIFAILIGMGLATISVLAGLQGKFVPFQSGADLAYRVSAVLLIIVGGSVLVAIMVDVIDRLCRPRR